MREEDGRDIINRLADKEVYVHIDPTMFVSTEELKRIAKPHKYKPKEKFAVTYFLGKILKAQKKLLN